ncbi:hypothetical protein [Sphingobacterium gobiense]|uniref:Uncharacterized protein n=1 Tax=Sphingobacterium gobiense TaxID=1382456 RepID=A0A2S9JIE1_9SPHI|nr:hypothetical protein [Sphingobacterium gobiense]PRD52761.1 hypothetical protein C5749_16230 [Sphingobacterium gobiense]
MLSYDIRARRYLFYFLLSFSILFTSGFTIAQTPALNFEGKYVYADSILGNAAYQYLMQADDTIKHGKFKFESTEEHFEESHIVEGISLTGNYSNNRKDGAWTYTHQKLKLTGIAKLKGLGVNYDANGTEFLINASFREGKIHGIYELLRRTVRQSNPADTLFYARLQYTDGTSTGTFLGFTPNLKVSGQFDEDGFPHGDWLFVHCSDSGEQMREMRRYDHGFFSKHFYKSNEELVEIKHAGFDTVVTSGLGLLTHLRANPTYFRALDYTPIVIEHAFDDTEGKVIPLDTVQACIVQGNLFLERVFVEPAMHRGKDIWKGIGGSESVLPVKLKVREFAFSPDEFSLNQKNEKLLIETRSLIRTVIDNPAMEVRRFVNPEVGFYYGVLGIYQRNLEKISPVVRFLADTAAEYIDHDAILFHNIHQISYPDAVEFQYQDQPQTRQYAFPPELEATDTRVLHTHLHIVYTDVNRILEILEKAVQDYEIQGELARKERHLIGVRDSVIRLFMDVDSNDDYNEFHRYLRDSVQYFMEYAFARYAKQSSSERVANIDAVQDCYTYFLTIYETIANYQEKLEKLDQEYTRSVWNPYTFTHMEERVKSRLYDVFESLLLPFFWNDIRENISCDTLPGKLQQLDALLGRMTDLRWKDTKDMERKLRRARKDIPTSLEILGLRQQIK